MSGMKFTREGTIRVARVVGAGLGGAIIGALVAFIWTAGATASGAATSACQAVNHGDFCVAIGPAAGAIAGSVAVISAATLITVATLGVRPKRLTAPLGCIVMATALFFTGLGFPGGLGPTPWAAAIAAGASLAAVALSVDSGRAQLAGWAAIVVILLASLVVPRTVARHEAADSHPRPAAWGPQTRGAGGVTADRSGERF